MDDVDVVQVLLLVAVTPRIVSIPVECSSAAALRADGRRADGRPPRVIDVRVERNPSCTCLVCF